MKKRIAVTYKFPNAMVCTCDQFDNQMPKYQGKYTTELHNKILKKSDYRTEFKGFNL